MSKGDFYLMLTMICVVSAAPKWLTWAMALTWLTVWIVAACPGWSCI